MIREACVHYDASDQGNFARCLRDFAREVGGTRESGYTLTAAGLAAPTDIIKELMQPETVVAMMPRRETRRVRHHRLARYRHRSTVPKR
jgi:hypothetical protein